MSLRPKSLLSLIILAFVLVALPFGIAAVRALLQVDRLAKTSETLVVQYAEFASESEVLRSQLVDLERSVRQYEVLSNPEMLDVYLQKYSDFVNRIKLMRIMIPDVKLRNALAGVADQARAVDAALRVAGPGSAALDEAVKRFGAMNEVVDGVVADSKRNVSQRLDSLLADARQARRGLAWQLPLLLAAAVALGAALTRFIVRPVRQTVAAIQRLGDGSFDAPIEIQGPDELAGVGRQLDWLRRRLREVDEEKTKFIRHVSHELKTPLAGILEGGDLLVDGSVGELNRTQQEIAVILRDNGIKLQQLIDNLLAFDQADARHWEITLSTFSLDEMLDEVITHHRLVADARRLHIYTRTGGIRLTVDRQKLRVVLDNLLSNAIKFSPLNGRIDIDAAVKGQEVTIRVRDRGPGVHPSDRRFVFKPFYQGRYTPKGAIKGSGLGLAVAAEFVDMHGGTIEIDDSTRDGAGFTLTLPMAS